MVLSRAVGGKVVVLGGAGFVGRYLVGRLADAGATVTVASRRPEHGKYLQSCGDVGQVTIVAADIADEAALRILLRDADTVVNLVGILAEWGRQTFRSVHVDGPRLLARLARRAGVDRFVHLSALGAAPDAPAKYSRSKAAGEVAVRTEFEGSVILRPSLIVGAEDRFFNRFAGMTRLAPCLPLIGGGQTKLQPIFVGDVADAVMAALADKSSPGRTYELAGPRVYSFAELMDLLLSEIGRRRTLVRVPYGVASILGFFLGMAPNPLLTRDQVRLLRTDLVVRPRSDIATIADLGVEPVAIEAIIAGYLARFRPAGAARRHTKLHR